MAAAKASAAPVPHARLRTQYQESIRPELMKSLGIANIYAAPEIRKITVSCGVGDAKDNKKFMENATKILERVTGQKPVITRAKRSIAQFRLREGMQVGCCVTLRGNRMYEFLDRFINVVVPRIRDFRGLKRKFDGRGNYNVGIGDQSVFPEISGDLLETPQGLNVAIVISGGNDAHSLALLEAYRFPFKPLEEDV